MTDDMRYAIGVGVLLLLGVFSGTVIGWQTGENAERLRIHTALCQQQGGVLQLDDTCLVGGHVGEKLP